MADDARLLIKIEDSDNDPLSSVSPFPSPPARDADLAFPDSSLLPNDFSSLLVAMNEMVKLHQREIELLEKMTPDRSDPNNAGGGGPGGGPGGGSYNMTEWRELFQDMTSGARDLKRTMEQGAKSVMEGGLTEEWTDLFKATKDSASSLKKIMQEAVETKDDKEKEKNSLEKLAGFFNPFQLAMQAGGGLLSAGAAGDSAGFATTAANAAAGFAKMMPGPGMGIGLAVNALTAVAGEIKKANDAIIRRGAELAPYSSDLMSANVQRDIAKLQADIREAQKIGPDVARFTKLQTEFEVIQQGRWAEFKAQWARGSANLIEGARNNPFMREIAESPFGVFLGPLGDMIRKPGGADGLTTPMDKDTERLTRAGFLIGELRKGVPGIPGDKADAMIAAYEKVAEVLIKKLEPMIKTMEAIYGSIIDWRDSVAIAELMRDNAELGGLLAPRLDGPPVADPKRIARVRGPVFGGI